MEETVTLVKMVFCCCLFVFPDLLHGSAPCNFTHILEQWSSKGGSQFCHSGNIRQCLEIFFVCYKWWRWCLHLMNSSQRCCYTSTMNTNPPTARIQPRISRVATSKNPVLERPRLQEQINRIFSWKSISQYASIILWKA